MDFLTDYRLEDYILNTRWEDFPSEVQQRAVVCAIDLFGALLLGSKGAQHRAGLQIAHTYCQDGEIPIIGSQGSYNLLGATIAMAHASNSFDIDDGHNMIKGHPGTAFVAGILSAALEKGASYQEYLTTLVVAYEVTIRWALAMQDHYGYLHSSGTYGAFGTATGVGRIEGLDRKQLNNALSIADFHAPMVPVMRAVEYPSMNKDGVPYGALVGLMAVLDTLAGSTGRTHLLEMPQYAGHLDSLGTLYHILELYFKPYTCCRWAHQPISVGIKLMQEQQITPEQIDRVIVHTFDSAARLSKIIPVATDEAQYNIAYPVASAIVNGNLGYLQIRDEALSDPRVIEMMGRLEFHVDPEMEARFPQERLAWVEYRLKDGRVLRSQPVAAPGEASDAVDLAWETEKFMRITAPILPQEEQQRILELLTGPRSISMRTIVDEINQKR